MYVDDIIFGSDLEEMAHKFAKYMQKGFQMSMLGVLKLFFGMQVTQTKKGVFISQSTYLREKLKQFIMEDYKMVSTLMVTS